MYENCGSRYKIVFFLRFFFSFLLNIMLFSWQLILKSILSDLQAVLITATHSCNKFFLWLSWNKRPRIRFPSVVFAAVICVILGILSPLFKWLFQLSQCFLSCILFLEDFNNAKSPFLSALIYVIAFKILSF